MENSGNPAQRLYNLIMKASQSHNKLRINRNSNPLSWAVWSDVFEINFELDELEGQLELISRLRQSDQLVYEVEALLLKNDNIDHKKYLKPFSRLKELFPLPIHLNNPFSYAGITPIDHNTLEFCIDAIAVKDREKVIDENELKILLSEIQGLYEEIYGSDIDRNLKRILLDMLKIMENAIHEYNIRGIERLHEAIERFIGIYFVNQSTIDNSNTPEAEKVKGLFGRFGSLYSFAADSIQLLGAGEVIKNTGKFITKLLSSGQ